MAKKNKLLTKLKDKEYRSGYVESAVTIGLPFQIRALRKQHNLTQEKLASLMGKKQNVISRLEKDTYGRFSLKTLFELASAFDVALLVKFVPFSKFLHEQEDRSPAGLSARSFEQEFENLKEAVNSNAGWKTLTQEKTTTMTPLQFTKRNSVIVTTGSYAGRTASG